MDERRFTYLYKAYRNKLASEKEASELFELLQSGKFDNEFYAYRPEDEDGSDLPDVEFPAIADVIRERDRIKRLRSIRITCYSAAAILLLCLAIGITYRISSGSAKRTLDTRKIYAAQPKGLLTLPDGSAVKLDTINDGLIRDGQGNLFQKSGSVLEVKTFLSNSYSLSVPGGGQYRLIFSEGGTVLLNANSSITVYHPSARERLAVLQGEGFFEVKGNPLSPFIVKVGDRRIRVIGTSFNVKAYAGEKEIRTTLISGALQVEHKSGVMKIVPGQEAVWKVSETTKVVAADTIRATNWQREWSDYDGRMGDYLRMIERMYGVHFELLDDPYLDQDVHMSFHPYDPLSKTLEMLNNFMSTEGYQIVVEGDAIIGRNIKRK